MGWEIHSRSIIIYSDNKASVSAITDPPITPRALLRRSGRPWLALIAQIIKRKTDKGAKVNIIHVKAHTDSKNKESAGNRCADLLAKRAVHRIDPAVIP